LDGREERGQVALLLLDEREAASLGVEQARDSRRRPRLVGAVAARDLLAECASRARSAATSACRREA
jgi:hypothetical protein